MVLGSIFPEITLISPSVMNNLPENNNNQAFKIVRSRGLLSIGKAATVLGVSIDTLRNWEEQGKLTSIRAEGGIRRYRLSELKKFVQNNPKLLKKQRAYQTTPNSPTPSSNEPIYRKEVTNFSQPVSTRELLDRVEKIQFGSKLVAPSNNIVINTTNEPNVFNTPQTSKKSRSYRPFFTGGLLAFALIFLLTGSIIASYLTFPQQTSSFLNSNNENINLLQRVTNVFLNPFNQAAEKSIALLFPNQAQELNLLSYQLSGSKIASEEGSGDVLSVSSLAKEGKILEINADIGVNGNLAVNGEGIFSENLTAPNILYSVVAGDNITITGDPQRPTITAVGGITAEADTLASVTGRGATTNTLVTFSGGANFGNTLNLGQLTTDPTTASNGATYYNTTDNVFRCYKNGSWVNCDTQGTSSSGDITEVIAGDGLSGGGSSDSVTLTVDATTTSTTTTTSANSGLEVTSTGIRLLGGCSDEEVLKWNSASAVWECGTAGGQITVQEADTTVSSTLTTLDFLGGDFDVSESPAGEANISLASTLTSVTGVAGDFSVADGDLTTSSTTATIFNTNATTLSIGGAATTFNIGPTGSGASTVVVSGGSADTGCTINGATGDLSCTGNITGGSSGTSGFWTRSGATLSPATSGDNVTTSGNLSTTGTGQLSIAGTATFQSTINTNTFTSTALTFSGATPVISASTNATSITLNPGSGGVVNLAGGSSSTGCTVDDTTGNLTCSGTIASGGGGSVGYWDRTGTTLVPVNSGDNVQTSGNIATTGTGTITSAGLLTGSTGLTISGGAASINASSNFNTTINTGTSTGAVSIGNSTAGALTLAAGATSSMTITNGALTLSTTGASGGAVTLNSSLASGNTVSSAFNVKTTTDLGATDELFQVGDSGADFLTVLGNGNVGIGDTSPDALLDVEGTEGSTVFLVTTGDGSISDGSLSITDDDNATSFSLTNNTATTVGAGVNTDGVADISSTSLTTGNLLNLETTTSLTTGKVLNISSTATALTTGSLLSSSLTGASTFTGNLNYFDWSPGSSTTASGDLFEIHIGPNGTTTGNLFNIVDDTSSIFSVSEAAVTTSLPANFTAAGDVNMAYDLNFTNQTSAYINSNGPLTIRAGESFENNDLTLSVYNAGAVVVDASTSTNTSTTGAFDINVNSTTSNNIGFNLDYGSDSGVTAAADLFAAKINLTQNDTDGDLYGLYIDNKATSVTIAGTNLVECLVCLVNSEAQAAAVAAAILIDGDMSTSGAITKGIDIDTTDITTDIELQNGETIDNNTDNQLNLGLGSSGTLLLTSSTTATVTNSAGALAINAVATGLNLQADGSIDVNIAGGSGSTGCTVANSTGNLTCTGNITGSSSGTAGFWSRTSTTLSPATSNDVVSISSNDNTNSTLAITNNTATTLGAGVNTAGVIDISSTSITTGNLFNLEGTTSLTSGRLANITSTSTALTTGNLLRLDWTPGSTTTATGDLFSLNIGSNGSTTGNLFNILDSSSSIFSVSETAVTTSLPANFTSAGDVSMAYDLNFINPTASYINSDAPLYVQAGESFNSSNLVLQTFNAGSVVIESASSAQSGTTGLLDINVNSSTTSNLGLNIDYITDSGASSGADGTALNINLTQNDADADQFGLFITGNATSNAAGGSYEALIKLVNAENTAGAVTDAILIDSTSGTDTDITDAIDVSDSNITNAINVGQNFILGDGIRQFSSSSTVWTFEDTSGNDLMTLTDAGTTGNALISGTLTVTGTEGSNSLTLTAGDAVFSDGSLSITDDDDAASLSLTNNTATTVGASAATGLVDLASTSLTTGTLLNLELTEGTLNGGHYLKAWDATGATTVFSVGEDGITTITGSEGSTMLTVTAGDAAISDGSLSITDDDNAASFAVTNNTATTVGVGVNTDGVVDISSTSLTTGNLVNLETTTALTSGRVLNVSSTTTSSSFSGNLGRFSWEPGSSTTASADLFLISIGTNGTTTGDLFDIQDTGSSLFQVSETAITASVPANFTSPGDVSIAYDLLLTNQTSSLIESSGPLKIRAGEAPESNDLTLQVYNAGSVVIDGSSSVNTGTLGVLDLNVNSSTSSNIGFNIDYTSDSGVTAAADLFAAVINLNQSDADGDLFGLLINHNANSTTLSGTNYVECMLCIENDENTAAAVADAIRISSTASTAGSITVGLDFDTTDITDDIELQNGETINNDTDGTVLIEDGGSTTLISMSTSDFKINLDDTNTYTELLCHSGADDATGVVDVGDCNVSGGGADLAEFFGSNGDLEAGEIVTMDANRPVTEFDHPNFGHVSKAYVTKASSTYQPKIIGIISTNPAGVVLSEGVFDQNENPVPVALSGRVPLKVSAENGPIQTGDYLTSSSIPGVAMKATQPGQVVGKALQPYTNAGVGKIIAFVNVSYADPNQALANLVFDENGNLAVPTVAQIDLAAVTAYVDQNVLGTNSDGLSQTVSKLQNDTIKLDQTALETASKLQTIDDILAAQKATTTELALRQNDADSKIFSIEDRLNQLEQAASNSANLADSTDNTQELLASLEAPEELLATGSATFADLKVTENLSSDKLLTALDVTVSGIFKALGEVSLGTTTVAGDFTVDGTFSITEGSTINALPTLYIQSSPLAEKVDFFNGLVTISKQGDIVGYSVTAEEFRVIEGKTSGSGTLAVGQYEVPIFAEKVTEKSRIFVTSTSNTNQVLSVTAKVAGSGFVVSSTLPVTQDVTFDWWIINEVAKANP